jgi:plasmid stability protein
MATLYVENVPDDLYEALRKQARSNRSSIAAEVLELLAQFVPTERELKRRQKAVRRLAELRLQTPPSTGPFPSTEETQREDRER